MVEFKIRDRAFIITNISDTIPGELATAFSHLLSLIQSDTINRRYIRSRIADNICEICPDIDADLVNYESCTLPDGTTEESNVVMTLDLDEILMFCHYSAIASLEQKAEKLRYLAVDRNRKREVKELLSSLEQEIQAMKLQAETMQVDCILEQFRESKKSQVESQLLQQRIAEIKSDDLDTED